MGKDLVIIRLVWTWRRIDLFKSQRFLVTWGLLLCHSLRSLILAFPGDDSILETEETLLNPPGFQEDCYNGKRP